MKNKYSVTHFYIIYNIDVCMYKVCIYTYTQFNKYLLNNCYMSHCVTIGDIQVNKI